MPAGAGTAHFDLPPPPPWWLASPPWEIPEFPGVIFDRLDSLDSYSMTLVAKTKKPPTYAIVERLTKDMAMDGGYVWRRLEALTRELTSCAIAQNTNVLWSPDGPQPL
jgi:hypothetical protein